MSDFEVRSHHPDVLDVHDEVRDHPTFQRGEQDGWTGVPQRESGARYRDGHRSGREARRRYLEMRMWKAESGHGVTVGGWLVCDVS